jgi:hypothetical protein
MVAVTELVFPGKRRWNEDISLSRFIDHRRTDDVAGSTEKFFMNPVRSCQPYPLALDCSRGS